MDGRIAGLPAEATLTLVAKRRHAGALVNNAAVTAQDQADPDPLNNSDAASVNASATADLRVTKAVSDAAPAVGGLLTYTIAVTNLGPSAATSADISDVLPASVTFVSATASQGTYGSASGLWTLGGLAGDRDPDAVDHGPRLGTRRGDQHRDAPGERPVDPNPLNDSASAAVTPQLVADLAIDQDAERARGRRRHAAHLDAGGHQRRADRRDRTRR